MAQRYQMTISLPQELRSEMAKFDENWSSIAQEAFRKRLAAIEHEKKARKGMDSVIARLKASKEKSDDEHFQRGKADGLEWAREHAEWTDLISIDRVFNSEHQGPDNVYCEHFQNTFEEALSPDNSDDFDREYFWSTHAGDDWKTLVDVSYLRGFVEGSLEVYEEVKDKV